MIQRLLVFFLLLLCSARCGGQAAPGLSFEPVAGGQALVLEQPFSFNGDSLSIDLFRCYIGHICLLRGGQVVATLDTGYHLLDAAQPESLRIAEHFPEGVSYDALRFNLGIDSPLNAAGAQGGDLDAVKGMYWAWQSGYVNLKLEGTSPRCTTRKHAFQYHLGGFRGADYCMRAITLPVHSGGAISILVNLDRFLAGLDLVREAQIMSPGARAVQLSALAASMFDIKERRQ